MWHTAKRTGPTTEDIRDVDVEDSEEPAKEAAAAAAAGAAGGATTNHTKKNL